jgi:glycopeptide antibiotics resistance protein
MNLYKVTLIFAEILSLILAGIWIVYKIRSMQLDDLVLNTATYSLFIYVAIGNLIEQIGENGYGGKKI